MSRLAAGSLQQCVVLGVDESVRHSLTVDVKAYNTVGLKNKCR